MARTFDEIRQIMTDALAAETTLSTLNNPSQTAEFKLWLDMVAQHHELHEQLWDILRDAINAEIAKAAPATAAWIKDKVLKFQYSATNPQVLQLIDYAPNYPTIDETLRIITRCAVVTIGNNLVIIKVAKGDPPTVLTTAEVNALTTYITYLIPAGISYQIRNVAADKIQVHADIYYDGTYSGVIEDSVKGAINTYLANLPPDGVVEVSELQNAMNDTPGVTDVRISIVRARRDSVAVGSATNVYNLSSGINLRVYPTYSASIVEETTPGFTFADTLNIIVNS